MTKTSALISLGLFMALLSPPTLSAQTDAEKAAANPIAKKLSFAYESNFQFGVPGLGKPIYASTFQPILPITVGPVNIINRPILPIIGLPKFTVTEQDFTVPGLPVPPNFPPSGVEVDAKGLGDLTHQMMFSPAVPGRVIWGAGGAFVFPTATDELLGNGKYAAGPSVVVLTQVGKATLGTVAFNVWSYAGHKERPSMNSFSFQYFANYSLGNGWSLATQPNMNANWKVKGDGRWSVPVGGGINKIVPGKKVTLAFRLHAYFWVVRPDSSPKWQLMFNFEPIFPL